MFGILGPSGGGKSYLAKAVGVVACNEYRAAYFYCGRFTEEMVSVKNRNFRKYQKKITYYSKTALLILDDFLLHMITDEREIKVLFEISEKRSELRKSTIVCSQREPRSWASMMMIDEISSNAILKRATKHYILLGNWWRNGMLFAVACFLYRRPSAGILLTFKKQKQSVQEKLLSAQTALLNMTCK